MRQAGVLISASYQYYPKTFGSLGRNRNYAALLLDYIRKMRKYAKI